MISQKIYAPLLLFTSFLITCSISAQDKQIAKLNFQYKKGFKMHFSGERINYDLYNFPKNKEKAFMEYSVTGDKQKGKEDVLDFRSTQNDGKDTVSFNNFLYFNEQGMFYWIWDEAKKIKQKNKTQAISLPLKTGKTWDSYYNKFNAKMECISTDSVIKTPLGEFKTFIVSATFINHQQGFDEEIRVTDFYNEDIGQVETQMTTTAIYKANGEIRKKLADVTLFADKMTKPN